MAKSISPVEFTGLPLWMTNVDEFDLVDSEAASLNYMSLMSPTTVNQQNESESPPAKQGVDVPQSYRYEKGFAQQGLQLPSPKDEEDTACDQPKLDKERRRLQNRAAQRAFRERKDSKLKQLEGQMHELKLEKQLLERKYNNLRVAHSRLQAGLKVLLDSNHFDLGDSWGVDVDALAEGDG